MQLGLGNSLVKSGLSNPDKLSLDLQFAADKSFSKPSTLAAAETQITSRRGPSPVFSRLTAATLIDSNGLIKYGPENLLKQSNSMPSSDWISLNGTTVSSTSIISPDGVSTLAKVTVGSLTANAGIYQLVNQKVSIGERITISCWMQSGTANVTRIVLNGETSNGNNFESNSITLTNTLTRYSWTFTVGAADTGIYAFIGCFSTIPQLGDFYIWGMQLERSSTARQYIPTTTGPVYGPRFDHDPVSPFACKGLLIEEARENLVFPSGALTTQTITVTAIPHTLSFYGTGTVVLSGAFTATVTGTGAYPTRTSLTFTPTAGSLTLTVTGSVVFANLERVNSTTGASFPTSYIPTTTGTAARSADLCSITSGAFNSFYNQTEGTLFADVTPQAIAQMATVFTANTTTFNNQHGIYKVNAAFNAAGLKWGGTSVISGAPAEAEIITSTDVATSRSKLSYSYKLNDFAFAYAGNIVGTDTSGGLPSPTTMHIGNREGSLHINGHLASVRYYRKRLPNAKLQAITA